MSSAQNNIPRSPKAATPPSYSPETPPASQPIAEVTMDQLSDSTPATPPTATPPEVMSSTVPDSADASTPAAPESPASPPPEPPVAVPPRAPKIVSITPGGANAKANASASGSSNATNPSPKSSLEAGSAPVLHSASHSAPQPASSAPAIEPAIDLSAEASPVAPVSDRPIEPSPAEPSASGTGSRETSSASAESAASESASPAIIRQQPIPPASEPMQYRAIGLVRGKYVASEEQFTRGTVHTEDGAAIDAVLLGRVMSLVKKHLDLEQPHLWVVYPRTREKSDEGLHVQIVGVWEPEKLSRPDGADVDAEADADEASTDEAGTSEAGTSEAEVETSDEAQTGAEVSAEISAAATDAAISPASEAAIASPEPAAAASAPEPTAAVSATAPSAATAIDFAASTDLDDKYFSVRGEVIFQSDENQQLLVKIRRLPRAGAKEGSKTFKVAVQGVLDGRAVGSFWELNVERQGDQLVLRDGTKIGLIPPQKRKGKPAGGRGGPRRSGPPGAGGPPRKRWEGPREGGPSRPPHRSNRPNSDRPNSDRPSGERSTSDRPSPPRRDPAKPISKPVKRVDRGGDASPTS